MNIKYFEDTDTLLISLLSHEVAATEDLDENTLVDVDEHGNICSITIEHACQRRDNMVASPEKALAAG